MMKYLTLAAPVLLALTLSAQATIIKTRFEKWKHVQFSHQVHVGKKQLACGECHYLDEKQDIASRKGHAFCKGCHYDKGGPMSSCDPCHFRKSR
jgi:formylmethanofuran dehydrogenase subunit E